MSTRVLSLKKEKKNEVKKKQGIPAREKSCFRMLQ